MTQGTRTNTPPATHGSPTRARFALAALIAALAALFVIISGPAEQADAGKRGPAPPNIVLIVLDDATLEEVSRETMPFTYHHIKDQGATFKQAIISTPTCCPSRATMLTGQYGHNHRVLANNPGYGALQGKHNVLPKWLRRAGYQTAHVGKFLNKYARGKLGGVENASEVAPGWDRWYAALEPRRYYDYKLRENGKTKHYGNDKDDYLTRVLTRKAIGVIKENGKRKRNRPLFLNFTPYAPHEAPGDPGGRCQGAAVPDPKDYDLFADGGGVADKPSFNELDNLDKPSFVKRLPLLSSKEQEQLARKFGCAQAALRGVDRAVEKIMEALKREGEMSNTAFIVISDNGFFFGEHRVPGKKQQAYEEAIHVPLFIRLPGQERSVVSKQMVSNIDIVPTILNLADAPPCAKRGDCRVMDGRSLRRLAQGDSSRWPLNRTILLEFKLDKKRSGRGSTCVFRGVRTKDAAYVIHSRSVLDPKTLKCEKNAEVERYDLDSDPFELQNLHVPGGPSDPAEEPYRRRLERLRGCEGIAGRDPRPPGNKHYCQ